MPRAPRIAGLIAGAVAGAAGITPLAAQPPEPLLVTESAAAYAGAPPLRLEPVRTWCATPSADGCDVRTFAAALLLTDGGVLASDAEAPVRRFSASGERLADVAPRGTGPGALRRVVAMRTLGADSVLILGNADVRVVRAALDGSGGTTARVVPPVTVQDMGLLGSQLVAWTAARVATAGETGRGVLQEVFPDPTRNRARFAYELPSPFVLSEERYVRPIVPLSAVPVTAVGAGGDAAYSAAATYRVQVVPAIGEPWQLVVDRPARRITPAERDSVVRTVRDRARRLSRDPRLKGASEHAEQGLRQLPDRHPALTALVLLRDGSLWIRTMPDADATRVRWDAFTRSGTRLGHLELRLQEQLLDGDASTLLVGRIDDAGVPSLTQYRVRGEGAGGLP